MAHQTEAACLLDAGVLYGKRTLLRPGTGDPVFVGFKPGAFSIYFGDAPIYHFDREGRWQRAYVDGLHVLKALDCGVQVMDRVREGPNMVLKRRTLSDDEAVVYDDLVRTTARELLESAERGRFESVAPQSRGVPIDVTALGDFLRKIIAWDTPAWLGHHEKYQDTYGQLPFLPPDCPSPVVLQATIGHEQGRTFGAANPSPHQVRSPLEFEHHARAVSELLGKRLEQCRAVFLGGSDVLRRPTGDVAAYLGTILRVFPVEPTSRRRHPDPSQETPARLDGVHAFLDHFAGPLPSRDDWERFHSHGLVRVTLGIESGSPVVRSLYGKNWSNDHFCQTVDAIKAAGIGVSPIVLLGAGGVEFAERHVAETAELINALAIGSGDIVALVDAAEVRASDPGDSSAPLAFTPLDSPARNAQRDELKARLEPVRTTRKAKVVPYSLDKQGAV